MTAYDLKFVKLPLAVRRIPLPYFPVESDPFLFQCYLVAQSVILPIKCPELRINIPQVRYHTI